MKIAITEGTALNTAIDLVSMIDIVNRGYYMRPMLSAGDPERFDKDNPEHLRAFYDAVMAHMNAAPNALLRVLLGYEALTRNGISNPQTTQ